MCRQASVAILNKSKHSSHLYLTVFYNLAPTMFGVIEEKLQYREQSYKGGYRRNLSSCNPEWIRRRSFNIKTQKRIAP